MARVTHDALFPLAPCPAARAGTDNKKVKASTMFSSTPSAAHREARHELDNLMEEAGDVVFRLDTDGLILFASKRAATLFGAPSGLTGHLLLPLATEASRAALQAALEDAAGRTGPPGSAPANAGPGNLVRAAPVFLYERGRRAPNCWWSGATRRPSTIRKNGCATWPRTMRSPACRTACCCRTASAW